MNLPRPRHVKQLQLYSWLLAKNGYPPPEQIRVVYMTMADLRTEEAVAPNEAALDKIQQQVLNTLRDILSETKPPEVPVQKWECGYCPFSQCSKNKNK